MPGGWTVGLLDSEKTRKGRVVFECLLLRAIFASQHLEDPPLAGSLAVPCRYRSLITAHFLVIVAFQAASEMGVGGCRPLGRLVGVMAVQAILVY